MKSVWDIDPITSEQKLNTRSFVHKLEGKWKTITRGGGISKAETQAYESIVEAVITHTIRGIDDLPLPSTWAEITALKVMFKNKIFLLSRHAVVAQQLFPRANLHEWKLNTRGPTGGKYWGSNPLLFSTLSLSDHISDHLSRNQTAQEIAELFKRIRSSETANDIRENENPLKKLRFAFWGPVEGNTKYVVRNAVDDTVENGFKDTVEDNVKDVEDTAADPSTSKQTMPPIPDDTGDSGDSGDSNKFWSIFENKLAPIRKAAQEGTAITTRMVDDLRKAHLEELKGQQPDGIFKQIEKQHARELRDIRARYEGVITAWLNGVSSTLQSTYQDLSTLGDYKE
ncbi:Dephospho-CoA kinase cab5 [Fusarium poae]|jgi:hypothetical protein|uniref:Uncharacterized protein n=1 Tax=Fusarium poae TaxID=36050 RepID=A0A1B8AKL3_FUSPO|nr:hypothetical protein FPOAC1_007998 [Fusarium poae]KAG8668615.1 hypothetical protein FPOAC1_007998 [Fusarium poae]OBS20854.1 hypothetical protein FPOA_07194 [Fusarium poae]